MPQNRGSRAEHSSPMSNYFCSSSTNTKPHSLSTLGLVPGLYQFNCVWWVIKQDESQTITRHTEANNYVLLLQKARIFLLNQSSLDGTEGKVSERTPVSGFGSEIILLFL